MSINVLKAKIPSEIAMGVLNGGECDPNEGCCSGDASCGEDCTCAGD